MSQMKNNMVYQAWRYRQWLNALVAKGFEFAPDAFQTGFVNPVPAPMCSYASYAMRFQVTRKKKSYTLYVYLPDARECADGVAALFLTNLRRATNVWIQAVGGNMEYLQPFIREQPKPNPPILDWVGYVAFKRQTVPTIPPIDWSALPDSFRTQEAVWEIETGENE